MKQKILYILVIITALIGGNGEAWAQSEVPGYNGPIYDMNETTASIDFDDWSGKDGDKTFTYICNDFLSLSITDVNELKRPWGMDGICNRSKPLNITLNWFVKDKYFIKITYLSCKAYQTLAGGNYWHSINNSNTKTGGISSGKATTAVSDNISLSNEESTKITTDYKYTYILNISLKYHIYHYELITKVLDEAISYANSKSSSIDESIRDYLTTAISNAITFKDACAFPNSYWNGSSVGKTPAEVTATAEKLTAITNYLIARTNANKYEQSEVPDAVYDWLHKSDLDLDYLNDFDASTINTATNDINAAISAAIATTSVYLSALTTINTADNSKDWTNDPSTLATDVANAKEQLEKATSKDGITSALANIKNFDSISFSGSNELQKGASIEKPANADSGKTISYSSDNPNVIVFDGTTLKAVGAGEVTITASTTTGNGYYGYTTTQTYTVGITLVPNVECNIVENVTYPQITLQRTFSAGLHYTLTLPFDSNISEIGGDYAAQLALVTYNKADGYTLYFQKVTDGQMVANQPYIVYAENGFKEPLNWANITVAETIEAKGVSNDRTQGWTMQGNYTPDVNMEGNYGIAGGKFRLGTKGSTINAYTAYFTFLGTEKVRARVAVMDEGGNTTYIGELKDLDGNAAEEVFGIDGMRLPEMRKGINIVRQKDGSVRKIVK